MIFVVGRDFVVRLPDDHSFEALVCVFTFGNLDQIVTAINATDVMESLSLEIAGDKAFTTAHFKHFAFHTVHGAEVGDHV